MNKTDNSKSITWINTCKAICIIGVFFIHCQIYYRVWTGGINQFVHTFYVNTFFFVSGYLLFWKQLSEPKILEDKKRYISRVGGGNILLLNVLYRIVIPSILFSTIEFFPSCIIQGRGIDLGFALYKTIGGGTYWFTSALVVAELLLLTLFCTRKRNMWFYVTICLTIGLVGLVIENLDVLQNGIWAWRQGLIALIFLAMGGLYWKYEKWVDELMRWWFVAPLLVAYIVMVVGLKEYNDPLISTLTIQPLGIVISVMACLLLILMCKKLPEVKFLSFIGQNSLGFYFLSGALPITFSIIAKKLLVSGSTFMMLAIWISCMIVAYVAVLIINRWLPWLWDLRLLKKDISK
jgi:fucose 4-O-acetylase-like acetyltransferase